jgi:hypothetical protein
VRDRSTRPHRSPRRTPTRTERRIIKIRLLRRWGQDPLGPPLRALGSRRTLPVGPRLSPRSRQPDPCRASTARAPSSTPRRSPCPCASSMPASTCCPHAWRPRGSRRRSPCDVQRRPAPTARPGECLADLGVGDLSQRPVPAEQGDDARLFGR